MASTTSSPLPQNSATQPSMSLPLLLRAKLRPTRGNPNSAISWSPPPTSRLRPPSLGSQKSPLLSPPTQSSLNSTRDYLRSEAMKILESPDTLPLTCFIEELNFPGTSTDLIYAQNVLNYLKNNYLTSFCFCLVSFYKTCGSEFGNCKEYAFDILCQILTEEKEGPRQETSFLDKEIKSAILDFLNTESSIKILNKIRDFVAEIASKEVRLGNDWPELLEFVYESLDSDSEEKVKYAVSLLYKLIPHCAVEDLVISLDSFYDSLVDIFDSDYMSLEIQVEAVLTSNRFLLYWTNRSNHERYSVLMIQIVETISTLIEHKSDKDVQAVVKELTVLTKEKPWTLSRRFDYVVLSVLRILGEVELQDKTRILALEFVIALAEERVQGRQMLLGSQLAIPNFLEKILLLLANLKDDSECGTAESDIQNLPSVRCLDRIVAAIGGEVLMRYFPRLFAINFCAEDWQSRHAAVLSLGIVAERCSSLKESKHSWDQMAGRIIRSVKEDIHPCVRCTALYTIKQFSKNLKPEFQDQYRDQVLPALTKAMDDFNYPRVQVQAYSALFEFTSNCTPSILNPYLKEIVTKLLKELREEKHMIKGETLKVLSAVAYSSQDQFAEYYSTVMPYLKVIMMTAKKELDHNLLADSVDCITMVWMAVGKEKIRDDTDMVVKMLISLQRSELEANDPMRCQLLQAWARLGKCLGEEFEPYMSVSIPRLLRSAKIGSYVLIPENPDSVDESDGSMRAMILGERKIWIKTKVLEEKVAACKGLYLLADELKEGLSVWIEEVAQTLVPFLNFQLNEEIRRVAASAMPVLLKSSKEAIQKGNLELSDESPFEKLCSDVLPALVKALSKESLPEMAAIILDSLEECMEMSGPVLDEDQTDLFLKKIMNVLNSRRKVGDIDVIKQTLQEEQKVYDKAVACLATFIRIQKPSFSPFLGKLLPCIQLMWEKDKIAKERRTGLRIFCDVAKQFPEEAFRQYNICLLFLFEACKDENPEVLEVAVQAIGIFSEFGGSAFKSLLKGAFYALKAVIDHPKALQIEYVMAHDAAVSALGKLLQFHREKLNAAQFLRTWLRHLPLENNLNEAKVAHHQLCSLVEVSDVELLGPTGKNLHKIVTVYAEILWAGKKLATEETVSQMIKQLELYRRRFLNIFDSKMSLEAYAQAVHNSTNFILYWKNRSNYYRYVSHLDQMVNTLFISRDDKNLDLSRFWAHGKKTLARIAAALGEEQVARTNSRRRPNQLLLGRDNEGSHKQTISFMKQNGGH
ncbi:importin-5-like [Populus alba x Populus x berolinensis]|uniref:Importin-5-like n=1 Tax=Populus alba x Populus x berolinensis TaxID=444605 RepID=A0AAD6W5V7_9ROSI|nr:importin-5-like [Populus alba x Populus x berolinensis]